MISVSELYEYALLPEHLASINPSVYPTTINDTGALTVSSGSKTGRTPKEKRVVFDDTTKDVSSSHIHLSSSLEPFMYRLSGGVASTFQSPHKVMPETEEELSISSI